MAEGLQSRFAARQLLFAHAALTDLAARRLVHAERIARWNGEPPREAVGIGALMNARGLMELIILNIGLERGVIGDVLHHTRLQIAR